MVKHRTDMGFTIVEMVVAIIVLALFTTLFIQTFIVSDSRRVNVTRRALADNISRSNLRKVTTLATLNSVGGADCDDTPGTSTNSIPRNATAAGDQINWIPGTFDAENISGTLLPADTTQKLVVLYPQGCNPDMPAKIISTVTYSGGTESLVHVAYINN